MPEWNPRDTARARELRRAAAPAERALWRHLSRGQLGARFSRQMPVGPWFGDFVCRSARLVVELDGFSHHLRPEADAARDGWMRDHGWRALRFANADVSGNVEGVVAAIRLALEELGALSESAARVGEGEEKEGKKGTVRKEEPTPNPSRKREGD